MQQIIEITVFIIFCYQLYVSACIFRSKIFDIPRKFILLILNWIIPLLGGLFVMHLIRPTVSKISDRYMGQSIDEHISKYGPNQ